MSNIKFEYTLIRGPVENTKEWEDNSFAWNVKLNGVSFDYFTGIGLTKPNGRPAPPILDDVLYSLLTDMQAENEGFEDWCDNLGYSTDSRKALNIYLACQEIAVKLRKTGINIEKEKERLQDY